MRMLKVTRTTGVGELLDARFKGAQAEVAMAALKAANPHVDLDEVTPGTHLFVPDLPAFRTSATETPAGEPLEALRALVSDGLEGALGDLRLGVRIRSAERAEVAAVLKSAAIRRQIDADPTLAAQAEDARKAFAEEEAADKTAEEDLQAIGKAALAALAEVGKLVG